MNSSNPALKVPEVAAVLEVRGKIVDYIGSDTRVRAIALRGLDAVLRGMPPEEAFRDLPKASGDRRVIIGFCSDLATAGPIQDEELLPRPPSTPVLQSPLAIAALGLLIAIITVGLLVFRD